MKDKIKIKNISKRLFHEKGFGSRGCLGANCRDRCCKLGADVDKVTYDLILKNRKKIEKILGDRLEDCFKVRWFNNNYLGGKYIKSNVRKDGYCSFHLKNKRGCVLYKLVFKNKINPRLIPSICRLFPVTWDKDTLLYYEELYPDCIPKKCNCLDPLNKTKKSLYDTQKNHIKDIFTLTD